MRRAILIFALFLAAASAARVSGGTAPPQSPRVVDRIVARIEDDIILQSQVRELGALQQLIDGRAESDDKLLQELMEQWMVQTEATASHFPQPAQSEVDRELARLKDSFASPDKYAARLNELGLSDADVARLLSRQIYVERYVDYKFRPSVQIEPADVDAYYKNELLPELAKNNQPRCQSRRRRGADSRSPDAAQNQRPDSQMAGRYEIAIKNRNRAGRQR